ncbi:MAG: Lrp/AsnC ligand binding domain-containing protein [Elusimicrobia bacterium]|jgi:DNA-binding Lrp family transcriptional regulator|nr:Lrp/AsnC ligand binding domain-containing protein [Elusimicrobiota bacterium]MBI2788653.1 Lrp/AsnC ligand binding domain-containing protein [Elusimicrobiota bacterium]MCM2304740.1 Lrp/AsnC ligand binding domain-containing protein [Elusimicrobiota bacterium]
MVTGLVLVRLMAGKEKVALSRIKEIKGVSHVTAVFGRWDLVLDIETEDVGTLSNVVVRDIRATPGVLSTESLVTTSI